MFKFDALKTVKIIGTASGIIGTICTVWVSSKENALTLKKEKMIEECLKEMKEKKS